MFPTKKATRHSALEGLWLNVKVSSNFFTRRIPALYALPRHGT